MLSSKHVKLENNIKVNEDFFCPIKGEIMHTPIKIRPSDKISFEKEAIIDWFAKGSRLHPATGEILSSNQTKPSTWTLNYQLQQEINLFLSMHIQVSHSTKEMTDKILHYAINGAKAKPDIDDNGPVLAKAPDGKINKFKEMNLRQELTEELSRFLVEFPYDIAVQELLCRDLARMLQEHMRVEHKTVYELGFFRRRAVGIETHIHINISSKDFSQKINRIIGRAIEELSGQTPQANQITRRIM